jgi:hypothetical protein
LKKYTFWKVTKDTIDIKNEELFNYAKSKSPNPPLWIIKRNTMHLPPKKKLEQKEIQE